MSLDADLATLRAFAPASTARVEAEIARLREGLREISDALDNGYWDVTTDQWRCAMCDRTEAHSEGCSHGEMIAKARALLAEDGAAREDHDLEREPNDGFGGAA